MIEPGRCILFSQLSLPAGSDGLLYKGLTLIRDSRELQETIRYIYIIVRYTMYETQFNIRRQVYVICLMSRRCSGWGDGRVQLRTTIHVHDSMFSNETISCLLMNLNYLFNHYFKMYTYTFITIKLVLV